LLLFFRQDKARKGKGQAKNEGEYDGKAGQGSEWQGSEWQGSEWHPNLLSVPPHQGSSQP
jgi:hypothetical protein